MKMRIHTNLIWFSVLGWGMFLVICFTNYPAFWSNPSNLFEPSLPVQYSIKAITSPKRLHTTQSSTTSSVQQEGKGHIKDNAGKQKVVTTRRKKLKVLLDDLEEYISNGRKIVRALWAGNVSSSLLSSRLQNAKDHYIDSNIYNVSYRKLQMKQLGKQELLCQLKQKVQLRTLDGTEEPFASLGWKQLVPFQPLDKLHGIPFRTCAVVSSAGSIFRSSLGKEIDSHDAVLRFNAAPTKKYERDVGSKTTIRVINSQVMAGPTKNFANNSLYKNITLVAWDPAPFSSDLHKWYESPDFDLFSVYEEYRRRYPSQPFYVLHPAFIWSLWTLLQNNTNENIQTNPPSTGFIGIVIMMSLCESVDIYEFIPSQRHTTLCHYFESIRDMACTLGAYHPLLFEKHLVRRMSSTVMRELLTKGKVTLPGFSKITCPP